jgi:hypothetical protein
MAKSSTTIDKESRKNIAPRGKGKKSLMLEAIKSVCGNEQDFLKKVVIIGLGGWTQPEQTEEQKQDEEQPEPVFQNPNPVLLTLVMNRIEPPLKSISPMVNFDFDPDAKPHEQASQVLQAVANSQIAPDIGQMFVSSIKSMIDIEEYTDLKDRIEKLEAALDGES